jgi:hypothetical protein
VRLLVSGSLSNVGASLSPMLVGGRRGERLGRRYLFALRLIGRRQPEGEAMIDESGDLNPVTRNDNSLFAMAAKL